MSKMQFHIPKEQEYYYDCHKLFIITLDTM